jgi:hypothetical protein
MSEDDLRALGAGMATDFAATLAQFNEERIVPFLAVAAEMGGEEGYNAARRLIAVAFRAYAEGIDLPE